MGDERANDGATLVRVVVDPEVCVGISACVVAEPDTFAFGDDGASHAVPGARLPRARAEAVRRDCPSGAIRVLD